MNVLILCTGNSCRSQMAEGFLKSISDELEVFSAGTHPASTVHPNAVRVMKEIGIDLSTHTPKGVEQFLDQEYDYVITVCGEAKESCPAFISTVKNRIHMGFEDPAKVTGSEEFVLGEFRRIRDQIRDQFSDWAKLVLSTQQS
ncbi:MAG: arsenate reductase ArsC [bacterium]